MSKVDTLIKNARLVLQDQVLEGSLAISDENIIAIGDQNLDLPAEEIIDAKGQIVLPGLVDPHAHIWEPTHYPEREDWGTGSCAAAAGGVTTLVEMPLSVPPVTNRDAFQFKDNIVSKKTIVDYALWGALTEKSTGNYAELHECGATSYKVFIPYASPDYPHTPDYALLKAMQEISKFDGLVGVHAENADIIHNRQQEFEQQEYFNGKAHEAARPEIAELEAVSRTMMFAEETGCRLHVCHLSTARGEELIDRAREKSLPITFETCPHYLVLDTEDLEKHHGFAKCNPPLRSPENREKLWQLVLNGKIDMLGTDHTPYTDQDREKHGDNIFKMPPGIGGMDLMLPLMIDEGVHKRGLSWPLLARLTSTNPARLMGLADRKGAISPGMDADLVFVDPDFDWKYSHKRSYAKAHCSRGPFEGRDIRGKVTRTLLRGKTIFKDGLIEADAGYGKLQKKTDHHPVYREV